MTQIRLLINTVKQPKASGAKLALKAVKQRFNCTAPGTIKPPKGVWNLTFPLPSFSSYNQHSTLFLLSTFPQFCTCRKQHGNLLSTWLLFGSAFQKLGCGKQDAEPPAWEWVKAKSSALSKLSHLHHTLTFTSNAQHRCKLTVQSLFHTDPCDCWWKQHPKPQSCEQQMKLETEKAAAIQPLPSSSFLQQGPFRTLRTLCMLSSRPFSQH